jgi:CHAD domain-containing protein
LRRLDAEGRHRLRVQLKTLRYACEFFLPLWPGEAAGHFVSRLVRLQNTLGADSDAEATVLLLQALGEPDAPADLQRAIGGVIGWQARDRLVSLRRLRRRWRQFRSMPLFWEG